MKTTEQKNPNTTLHIRQFPRALMKKLKEKCAKDGITLQAAMIKLARSYANG